MAGAPAARVVTEGVPAGRLAAIRRERQVIAEPVLLALGDLEATLGIDGLPLADLPPGTRLRIGDAAVVEIGDDDRGTADGGLRDAEDGEAAVPARVLASGVVRPGDPVVVEAVTVPLEDALDLHPFRPDEVADVVGEYLSRAHTAGFTVVRIIHGRGRGVQRATVRRVLASLPVVADFGDASNDRGGWGATIVWLRAAAP